MVTGRSAQLALVAALVGGGCGPRITEVALDDLDFEYLFLVTADEASETLRVAQAVARRDGSTLPGATLEGHERRFYLVSLSAAALEAALAGLAAEAATDVTLAAMRPPPQPRYLTDAGQEVQDLAMALPPGTRVFTGPTRDQAQLDLGALEEVPLASSLLMDRLTLSARVDTEFCRRAGQGGLKAFAAEPTPLLASEPELSLTDLEWLDADHVLVSTAQRLAVVQRGAPFVATPRQRPSDRGSWVGLTDFGPVPRGEQIAGFVLLPADAAGRRVVLVHGGFPPGPERQPPGYGWLRVAEVNAGGLRWQGEARIEVTRYVVDGAVTAQGDVALGADGNHALRWVVGTSTATREHTFSTRNPVDDRVFRIVRTDHADYPLVASTRGQIHTFSVPAMGWTSQHVEQTRILAPELYRPYGLAADRDPQGNLRIWSATHIGDVLWQPDRLTDFNALKLVFPPRFTPCSSASTDGTLAYERRDITDVALQDGYALLTYHDCSALVQIQRAEPGAAAPQCVTLIPPAGEVPRHLDDVRAFRRRVITRPGRAVVGTADGGLYITEW